MHVRTRYRTRTTSEYFTVSEVRNRNPSIHRTDKPTMITLLSSVIYNLCLVQPTQLPTVNVGVNVLRNLETCKPTALAGTQDFRLGAGL